MHSSKAMGHLQWNMGLLCNCNYVYLQMIFPEMSKGCQSDGTEGINPKSNTNVCLYEQVSKPWSNFDHCRLLRSLSASCFHLGSSTTVSCVTSTGWNFLRTKICIRGIVTQETVIQASRIPNSKPTKDSSIKTNWLRAKSEFTHLGFWSKIW